MLKCVIVPLPGREISGILPNNKRISEETVMCLNKREILKCMKQATVYGIRLDGERVLLTDSETINKEIMGKVEEKKEMQQHSILDITGTTREEKKEIVNNINEVQTNSSNNNSNINSNNQNYKKNGKNKNHYNNQNNNRQDEKKYVSNGA